MQSKLSFIINSYFDLTINDQLKQLALFKMWDAGLQKYLFCFPLDKLNEVIALTGKEIDFDGEKQEILNLIQHTPSLKEELTTERYKGKGYLYIQRFPKLYIVKTMQRKQEVTTTIPAEIVDNMWQVVKSLDRDKKYETRVVAENQLKRLKIDRYHKESGYFQFNKLFGERCDYFKFVYYPLKILQHYQLINYHKQGFVERIKEIWESQPRLG